MKNNTVYIVLDEIQEREIIYKLNTIKKFLVSNQGIDFKLYNRTCPMVCDRPDSNIVEYCDDVIDLVNELIKINHFNI